MMDAGRGLLLICWLCPFLTNAVEPVNPLFKNIEPLVGKKAIEEFKSEIHVRVIYFYKPEYKNRYKLFLKEMDKSVEFLDLYNVKICMVDCSSEENKAVIECGKPKTERSVFTYRGGMQLLQLELETMFDVNSIMSNLLQLVLLRDVPIFQSTKEVETFLGKQKGKQDVIFAYMKAIGTFDHRVFMEVAYAYLGKIKFALCTDKRATVVFDEPIPGSETSTLWWVWTKDTNSENKHVGSLQYKGALNLAELARFVKYVTKPLVYNIPEDGLTHTHDVSDIHLLTFYYQQNRKAEVYNIAEIISKHFVSVIGIVTINMDGKNVQREYKCDKSLPAVSLIRKGEEAEEFFKEDLNLEALFQFIEERIEIPDNRVIDTDDLDEEDTQNDVLENDVSHYQEDLEAVELQDDKVSFSVSNTKKTPMLLDLIPALTDKTFNTSVKAGPISVVLFYFPFTAVNSVSLRYFGEAADKLGEQTSLNLGRVNCYDWTDVCQDQNIELYPTLRIYRDGKMAWDYEGPLDVQQIYSMLKIFELGSPLHLVDPVEIMTYIVGQGETDIAKVTNTTVVGLFDKKSSKEMDILKTVSLESRDRIMFVYTDTEDSEKIAQQFGREVPCILLSKLDDAIQPHVFFEGQYTVENIQNFIEQNKLPKLTELTPLMFPELRKQGDSMVILFADETSDSIKAKDQLREMIKTQKFNNVSFTTLPTVFETSVAYKVLKIYTTEPEVPFLSYIDFKKGEVFNFGRPSSDRQNMMEWLGSVVKGNTEPSLQLTETDWSPKNKGYDFLKMMDDEAEQTRKDKFRVKDTDDPDGSQQEDQGDDEVPEGNAESSMEDTLDANTRKELFKSRLYHQAPGRLEKQKSHHGHDEL